MSTPFAVGDPVTYHDAQIGTSLSCRITKVMPRERYGLFYHIRDPSERYERSVPESTLALMAPEQASDLPQPPLAPSKTGKSQ